MGLRSGGLVTLGRGTEVYSGSFVVSSTGPQAITGVGFEPNLIDFRATATVESEDSSGANPSPDYAGPSIGFARKEDDGTITQKTTHGGGSGDSINDTGYYSSTAECCTVRYADQNGSLLGRTELSFNSFDSDGFEVEVNSAYSNQVFQYTAYKQ